MAQEYVISNFSGGINPSVQADKLNIEQLGECLQAQNARLDEFGGIQSCPGSTLQNTATYTDTAKNSNVHSLFVDSAIGAIAGVGQDAFTGAALGSLTDALNGSNTSQNKMSAGGAPTRIYFDYNSVGYAFDPSVSAPVTIDWAPPQAGSGASTTGTCGTGGTVMLAGGAAWSTPSGITGTGSFATVVLSTAGPTYSQYLKATGFGFSLTTNTLQGIQVNALAKLSGVESNGYVKILATLLRNGVAVGVTEATTLFQNTAIQLVWGNSTFLWSANLTGADLNGSNFGVIFTAQLSANASLTPVTLSIQDVTVTASQVGTGFVAGTSTAGSNLAGTYTWAITNVANDGAESDLSSPSLGVSCGSVAGTLTSIPAGDARTVARNIYRIGGTMNSFYQVGSIADNVSTTYFDNLTDIAAITAGSIAAGGVAGLSPNSRLGNQPIKYPCYHYDRLFWVTPNAPNQIIWSKPLNGYAYPAVNFALVGDSKPITGIISKWGCLIIIKTDSIWILSGTDENSFSLARTESIVGTDQPFTITSIANGVIFVNSQGPWVFNGAVSTKLTGKLNLLFRNETRNGVTAIETTNKAVTVNHCATANGDFFYYACAALNAASNNLLFVLNLTTGTITTRSLKVRSLTVDNTSGFVYAGLFNGQIVQLDDYRNLIDSQGSLPWIYQSGYTDLNARGSNLEIWSFEFYGNTNGVAVTPTIYYDGGNTSETLASFITTSNHRVQRKFINGTSRKAQSVSIQLAASVSNAQIDMTHIKIYYDVLPGLARGGK